jgi:hypothetical protein
MEKPMSVTFKKLFNTFSIYLLAILLSACGKELIGTTQVGKILSIENIQVAWDDKLRSRVITTKGSYVVVGQFSISFDMSAWINEYDDGNSYLCMTGKDNCYYVKID